MIIKFRIDHVLHNAARKTPHIFDTQLNHFEYNFQLTDSTTLGGYEIIHFSMPRALDEDGNPRFDCYVFRLKDRSNLKYFKAGQEVELIE